MLVVNRHPFRRLQPECHGNIPQIHISEGFRVKSDSVKRDSYMPRIKNPLLPIFLIVLVDIFGLTLILPLLPFYAERYGASPFQVGLLTASYALFQLIAGPVLGAISDRIGRRPMLILSQVGTLIGFLILAQATTLAMVFVSRIVDGATAGNLSLAQAYISDVTVREKRAQSFAIIGISFGLGFLIGPAVSGFLSQYGYQYPIYAAAGLSALSILATTFLLPKKTPYAEDATQTQGSTPQGGDGRRLGVWDWSYYSQFFKRPELGRLLIEFFLFIFSFSFFIGGFALFAERRFHFHGRPFGPKEVGYLYAYGGLLGLFLQGGLVGRLVKIYGERKLIRAGFLSSVLSYSLLSLAKATAPLIAANTVGSFGNSVLRPCLTSLVTQRASREEQGVVLGLTQSISSVSAIIAPLIGAILIGQGWLKSWCIVAASVSLIGWLLASQSVKKAAEAIKVL